MQSHTLSSSWRRCRPSSLSCSDNKPQSAASCCSRSSCASLLLLTHLSYSCFCQAGVTIVCRLATSVPAPQVSAGQQTDVPPDMPNDTCATCLSSNLRMCAAGC